jgi:hypothetical protein
MVLALISLTVFVLFVLIAIRIGFNRNQAQEQIQTPIIHGSGIYSVIRKSPREDISECKPTLEEFRKYLCNLNENINNSVHLSDEDITFLVDHWNKALNASIDVIEQGDFKGIEFYYFNFEPHECPECAQFIKKGQFVTREEIFQHPQIIPPFHIGCTTMLVAYEGKENLRDTTEFGMTPLFKNGELPLLPNWKTVSHLNAVRGTIA